MPQPDPSRAIPDYLPENDLVTPQIHKFDQLVEISLRARREITPLSWEPQSPVERKLFKIAKDSAVEDVREAIAEDESLSDMEKQAITRIIPLKPLLHTESGRSFEDQRPHAETEVSMAFEIRDGEDRWLAIANEGLQAFSNPVLYEVRGVPGKPRDHITRFSEAAFLEAWEAFRAAADADQPGGNPDLLYDILAEALDSAFAEREDLSENSEILGIRCSETTGNGVVETRAVQFEYFFGLDSDGILQCHLQPRHDPFVFGHEGVVRSYAISAPRAPQSEVEDELVRSESKRLRNLIEHDLQNAEELRYSIDEVDITITQPRIYFCENSGLQIDFLVSICLPDDSYVGLHEGGEIELSAFKMLMSCSPRVDDYLCDFLYSSYAFVDASARAFDVLIGNGNEPSLLAEEIQKQLEHVLKEPLEQLQFRKTEKRPSERDPETGSCEMKVLFTANGRPVSIHLTHNEGSLPQLEIKLLDEENQD